jgi:thiol-disulfide isomerase/thioredoxin
MGVRFISSAAIATALQFTRRYVEQHSRWTQLSRGLFAVLVSLQAAHGLVAQVASRYRMEGIVTEEGTVRPVEGVTVQVLIQSEREAKDRVRSARTDATGNYSIDLPPGHGWSWGLLPPAGYSPVKSHDLEHFATTARQPAFRKDYQVRKGIAWKVDVQAPANAAPFPKIYISGGKQLENEYLSAYVVLEGETQGILTLPDVGGIFDLRCGDEQRTLIAPEPMKLTFEKGFRTDRVKASRKLEHGATELRDDLGLTATIVGPSVALKDETATLVIPVQIRQALDRGTILGRIIDSNGSGLGGARVRAALHGGGGSASSDFVAISEADGTFQLYLPNMQQEGFKIALIVTAEGYGGLDTEPQKVDFAASKTIDVGTIKLPPAAEVRVRLVGPEGEPLEGAILEPLGSYAAREQIARSEKDGYCMLTNLAPGVQKYSASFGTLNTTSSLPLVAGDNEMLVVKLAPPRAPALATAEPTPAALKKGTPAPAWEISAWTDGKSRKLADYRGQVVVLDFWGVWCGPCIGFIPVMKELHEKYADKGVVFLGIHTAGTDMSVVQRLLKQQEWQTVTGLDAGDDIVTGATVKAFAVHGFPTVMVIDREGKIAFNNHDLPEDEKEAMKFIERLVKELGFPWPIDEGVTREEASARMTKLNIVLHSREIERALAAPEK